MSCPYAAGVHAVGAQLSELVQSQDICADSPTPTNPYGAVVIVYCRDCDCTHASAFASDGETAEAKERILGALCTAIDDLTKSESEYPHEQIISREKTTPDAN